jgi:hypothetical protein
MTADAQDVMRIVVLALLVLLLSPSSAPAGEKRADPVVVHVIVPLCHNDQIDCGSSALGDPDNLRTNLYWGALYGARRMFERKRFGYEKVPQQARPPGVLERAVFRRWAGDGKVEHVTVLDAIDGNRINEAVVRFYRAATEGEVVTIDDGDERRRLIVDTVGYAGHNRLMDDVKLPKLKKGERQPIPSFVLACYSHSYFSKALMRAGSTPLVMTQSLMAPEGYVVEAASRGVAAGDDRPAVRERVVRAYAEWQKIGYGTASRVFAKLDE